MNDTVGAGTTKTEPTVRYFTIIPKKLKVLVKLAGGLTFNSVRLCFIASDRSASSSAWITYGENGRTQNNPKEPVSKITSFQDPETKIGAADHLLPPPPPYRSTDSFLFKPSPPKKHCLKHKHMAGSKHFISVHYHQTNHINLQEAAVAILSEPEGVQIHVLMTIKLCVF